MMVFVLIGVQQGVLWMIMGYELNMVEFMFDYIKVCEVILFWLIKGFFVFVFDGVVVVCF